MRRQRTHRDILQTTEQWSSGVEVLPDREDGRDQGDRKLHRWASGLGCSNVGSDHRSTAMEASLEGLSWKECEWTVSSTSQMSEKAQLNEKAMAKGRSRDFEEEKTHGPHRWAEAPSNEPEGVQLTPGLVNSGHHPCVHSGIPLYCQKQHY